MPQIDLLFFRGKSYLNKWCCRLEDWHRGRRLALPWEAMFSFVLRTLSELPNQKNAWKTSRSHIEKAKLCYVLF